jgi:hypothetical protein
VKNLYTKKYYRQWGSNSSQSRGNTVTQVQIGSPNLGEKKIAAKKERDLHNKCKGNYFDSFMINVTSLFPSFSEGTCSPKKRSC